MERRGAVSDASLRELTGRLLGLSAAAYRLSAYVLGPAGAAEDAVQQAYLEALRQLNAGFVPQDIRTPGQQSYLAGALAIWADSDYAGLGPNRVQFDNVSVTGTPDPVRWLACPIVRALREQPAVVPVWLNDGEGVAAFQFDLYYDATMLTDLTAPGVVKGSLIADDPDWLLFSNLMEAGHLRVVAYNSQSQPLPAGAHGEIVQAWFTVNPAAAPRSAALLDLEGVVLSDHEGVAMPSAAWDGAVRIARAAEWFEFDSIASPQCGDPIHPLPLTIFIRAKDEYGEPATLYNGSANLTDLTGTIQPTPVSFSGGVCAVDVQILQPIASDQITATDVLDAAVTGVSNTFQVLGRGDPTGDGQTNVLDVVRTVNIALELMQVSGGEFAAADANGDGQVNVLDVIIIQNMALGIEGAGGAVGPLGVQAAAANGIGVRAAGGKPASPNAKRIAVPVLIDSAAGVAGFNFDLAYDGATLTPVEVRAGALLGGRTDWVIAGNLGAKPLRALGYSSQAQPLTGGKGTLVEIIFAQSGGGGKNSLALGGAVISDGSGSAFARSLSLGKPYQVR